MEKNSVNNSKKNYTTQDPEVFNDQIGENASEEFKSDEYANAPTNNSKTKGIKS